MDHGHHVQRVCGTNAVLRMHEKLSTFLRLEILSNNLKDFGLKNPRTTWKLHVRPTPPSPTILLNPRPSPGCSRPVIPLREFGFPFPGERPKSPASKPTTAACSAL